jgi:hypothetical protein
VDYGPYFPLNLAPCNEEIKGFGREPSKKTMRFGTEPGSKVPPNHE